MLLYQKWSEDMKRIVAGLLAHVDAGKTTLSEAILYTGNVIRTIGRVDNQNAFLDNYEMERQRGITIFSKQAHISLTDTEVTLIDTPGHMDFSAEMERTLGILDVAVLVISAVEGVEAHTVTLWKLLKEYNIPTFIFVNKMDRSDVEKSLVYNKIRDKFGDNIIDFSNEDESFFDAVAMTDESAMEEFLEKDRVDADTIKLLIACRKVIPCFWGSALKCQGIQELLEGIDTYTKETETAEEFGGRIYKILRDENGVRQTFLKVTSGVLKVKDIVAGEKINRIRMYNGAGYETVNTVSKGMVCALEGPLETKTGTGVGIDSWENSSSMVPVLRYSVVFPSNVDPIKLFPEFLKLSEEFPELCVEWNEEYGQINMRLMGRVQLDIVKNLVKTRLGIDIDFDMGSIVYKETITNIVEGVGHYEPLKHYAEVHLLMEPLAYGEGLVLASQCSEDDLDLNWQRLILTHLEEKAHRGVLTGSEITDMKLTVVAGKAHKKHTEGGDFRQATYRAVRQGLMEAESVLLEPMYDFELEIPSESVGRAMSDIKRMSGSFEPAVIEGEVATIIGRAPVSEMLNYHTEVLAYSRGKGVLRCSMGGYESCHNAAEIIDKFNYDPVLDTNNPSGSIFCSHGAGINVPWDEVKEQMHLPSCLETPKAEEETVSFRRVFSEEEYALGVEEVDDIIKKATGANQNQKKAAWKYSHKNEYTPAVHYVGKTKSDTEYILLDGYNVIHAWKELAELCETNMDSARDALLEILCNYQAIKKSEIIAVFDAYRVKGHREEYLDYKNIHVVYTAEAQTADRYIERFAHQNATKYNVTVVTSDGAEQVIVMGAGCNLFSSREFEEEVKRLAENNMSQFNAIKKQNATTSMSEIIEKSIDIFSSKCNNSND